MRKGLVFISFLLGAQLLLSASSQPPRYPVILVGFEDQAFSLEESAALVQQMLSKHNFNYDGATGSLLDYYEYNSGGRFCPEFDVYGPVTLSHRMQDYGRDVYSHGERVGDKAQELVILEACQLVDDQVDFSKYDADGDGVLDLVIVVFAGYDQSAGGKADALWAQQWDVRRHENAEVNNARLDGVALGQYMTAPELQGATGTRLCGIGTLCHEMGHFLGLPDFYDTNGSKSGNSGGVYGFSLMGEGAHNNDGHTPPTLNALELYLLGWLEDDAFDSLPEGIVRLKTVREGGMYVSPTGTEGEFFLYEYRNGQGWDAPLPEGLVIYRVDQSARMVGEHSALSLWEDWRNYNGINCLASHPCFHIVPASAPDALAYDVTLSAGRMVYPGLDQVLFYEPVDWEGAYTPYQLTNIGLEEGAVHFRVLKNAGANVNGCIYDLSGTPLKGVSVCLEDVEGAALTDADGFFSLPISSEESLLTLSATKVGYAPLTWDVSMDGRRMVSVSLRMSGEADARQNPLSSYDKEAQMGYYQSVSVLGGVRFGPEDLFPYVGQELREVAFYPYLLPSFDGEIYVVVDLDGERVLTRKVETLHKGPYFKQILDISDAHIIIPEGRELYIGYGSNSESASFRVGTVYPGHEGNSFYSPFSLAQSSWRKMYVKTLGIYMDVALSATVLEQLDATSLCDHGYAYIEPPQGSLHVGDRFPLKVQAPEGVKTVNWTVDGRAANGLYVTVKAGTQTIRARLEYEDGRVEVVELLLQVD